MPPLTPQIILYVAIAVALLLLMVFIRPKMPPREQFLLQLIRAKSPQIDNVRLFMAVKMAVRPVDTEADLEFQQRFLEDPQTFKTLCEQFEVYGAKALYSLLAYEALNWGLDPEKENILACRLAASQVCHCYPKSAEIIEELLKAAPDGYTAGYLAKNRKGFPTLETVQKRYHADLIDILEVIAYTPRNEWWPGTHPGTLEWAKGLLQKNKT
jgi:hypothetical protein